MNEYTLGQIRVKNNVKAGSTTTGISTTHQYAISRDAQVKPIF